MTMGLTPGHQVNKQDTPLGLRTNQAELTYSVQKTMDLQLTSWMAIRVCRKTDIGTTQL